MKLKERLKTPTSGFFKKIIKIGLTVGLIGGAIITAPSTMGISVPAAILTIAKIMAVAGTVSTAVAKTTVEGE